MHQLVVRVLLVVLVACAAAPAQTLSQWLDPISGSWTNPTMWSTNPVYPNNGTPAGATYRAVIGAVGNPYTVNLNESIALDSLSLTSPDATFVASAGSLTIGTFAQSAGTTHFVGAHATANTLMPLTGGRVTFSAGTLEIANINVTDAQFDHTGGAHHVESLHLLDDATYRLSGGTLELSNPGFVAGTIGRGGTGTFHQTGGTYRVTAGTGLALGVPSNPPHVSQTGLMIIEGAGTRFISEQTLTERGEVYVGWGSNSFGTIHVRSGAEAELGYVVLGLLNASGTLHVSSGAHAHAITMNVGGLDPSAGGHGTVILDGAASRLTIGTLGFTVGPTSGRSARLIVNDGRLTVSAAFGGSSNPMRVNRTGVVEIHGGFFDCRRNLVIDGGRFQMDAGAATTMFMQVLPGGRFEMNAGEATVQFMQVSSGGTARIAGGRFSCGSISLPSGTSPPALVELHGGRFNATTLTLNGGRFVVAPGSDVVPLLRGVVVNVGQLDLGDSAMVVDFGATSPLPGVRAHIVAGRNGGGWDGDGIVSSVAATQAGYALGYAEAAAIFTSFPAPFAGWDVDDTAVIVRYTRLGDANLDGAVNLQDFNRLAGNFGASGGALWHQGDFNYDERVDLQDFNLLAGNFGLSAGADGVLDPSDWAALASAVPEASSASLALLALTLLAPRRGRAKSSRRRPG